MTKSLQRISAMASALAITFTTTMALAWPQVWDEYKARKKRAIMEKVEGVLEPFDFGLQIKRTLWSSGPEDLLGRNFDHVLVIWVMFFALTMVSTKNWKVDEKSPYRHHFCFLGAYVLSVVYGRIYEGMRTFRHPDSLEYSGYMLTAVPFVLLLGLAAQHNFFRNLKTAFGTEGALREYLNPFNRVLPLHALLGYKPATAGGPPVVPTPDTDPGTTTAPGQSDDTTDSADSEPSSTPRLRTPKPTFEELIPMTTCVACGYQTPVGGKCCVMCQNDPSKPSAMVSCPRCEKETPATGSCCVWCRLDADEFSTREKGVTTSSQDDSDLYDS